MTHIDVFDPPMCCSTGVCGPGVDPVLAAFAADVEWLTAQGVTVVRHNLSQDPQPFVSNTRVLDLMQREGAECLPIVLVNGEELGHGAHGPFVEPELDERAADAGEASGFEPRTVVAEIIGVRSVEDMGEPQLVALVPGDVIQLALAVEATIGTVGDVLGTLDLE